MKRDLCGLGFFFRNKKSTQGRQRPLGTALVEAHKNTQFIKSLFTALLSRCGRSVSDSVQAATLTRKLPLGCPGPVQRPGWVRYLNYLVRREKPLLFNATLQCNESYSESLVCKRRLPVTKSTTPPKQSCHGDPPRAEPPSGHPLPPHAAPPSSASPWI